MHTGSAVYLKKLVEALRANFPSDEFEISVPSGLVGKQGNWLGKLAWEHLLCPLSTRGSEVVHTPYFGPPFFGRCDVVTVHDLIALKIPEYRSSRALQVYTSLASKAVRRANIVIADSESAAHDIESLLDIPSGKIAVIPLGVDSGDVSLAENDSSVLRDKYRLPDRYLLYLGSGELRKNIQVLLRAMAATPQEDRIPLILAGAISCAGSDLFPDYVSLGQYLGVSDDVTFIGPVSDREKIGLMASASAFVFPSIYEGFGLEPLEAMALGTPVICSNAGSLPEVVGNAAITLPPDDISGWSKAMGSISNNTVKAQHFASLGLNKAKEFTWDRTARMTYEIYKELI
tara:strand:- start:4461 stop:5495 length:1035 start_codon:yes stop_codon:yes gene_type:complete